MNFSDAVEDTHGRERKSYTRLVCCTVLQCVLQCVVVCCSVLQCIAVQFRTHMGERERLL